MGHNCVYFLFEELLDILLTSYDFYLKTFFTVVKI